MGLSYDISRPWRFIASVLLSGRCKDAWPGPALPDGEGRVAALAVAVAYRAVATAARGIISRLVSGLPSTGLGSSPQDPLGQHLLDPFPVGRLVELDLQHVAAP